MRRGQALPRARRMGIQAEDGEVLAAQMSLEAQIPCTFTRSGLGPSASLSFSWTK